MNEELQTIIETSISFFDTVKAFGYSLEPIDIFSKKGKKNFEYILEEIIRKKVFFPYSKDFVKTDFSTNQKIAIAFFDDFLGQEASEPLSTIPIQKKKMTLFDGATEFCYDLEKKTITASKIVLFRTDLSYNALTLCHENTHILWNRQIIPGFHYQYNELLPILIELIGSFPIGEYYQDSQLLENYLRIRIKTLQEQIKEYKQAIKLQKTINSTIICYSLQNAYTYIVSTIYAIYLFELYKENPGEIQKLIKACLLHQTTIETILQECNVSFQNPETTKIVQKVLQKI